MVESLPVRLWTQQDATFKGAEAEALVHLFEGNSGDWDLRVFGDYVKAELDGSGSRSVDIAVPHGDHDHNYTVDPPTAVTCRVSPRPASARPALVA